MEHRRTRTASPGTRLADATDTARVRFASKLAEPDANGCINWLGTKTRFGHGKFRLGGSRISMSFAHRAAWVLKRGDISPEILVLHKCDNPSCVNVDHLYLGSAKNNTRDMVRRGRHAWKNAVPWQKLHSADKERIRDLRCAGHTQQEIANWFGVSRPLISLVLSGNRYPSDISEQRTLLSNS